MTGRYVAACACAIAVGGAAAGAAQVAGRAFTVGTASAAPGERATGVIHVPPGADAGYDVPVAVVHGARPGPVLAVVAGAHGTEYASILAVEDLITARAIDPARMAGTLILVPIVNVGSFEQIVPHVNPVDRKSMNGQYPGKPDGTQTDRASYAITKEVVDKCDHLIDLHGGDLDENLRPYSYWTITGNQKQDDQSKALVLAFGLDHIIISTDRPKDPGATRFLDNTASARGKASFAAEAGRSGPVAAGDVAMLVRGVEGVMAELGMLPPPARPAAVANPVWIEQVVTVSATRRGVFRPLVDRDARVEKGQKVAVVTDYVNHTLEEVVAPASGIVLFVRAVPSLKPGDTMMNIGVPKKGAS